MTLTQKWQGKSLSQIKYSSKNSKQSYIQQRARAAYIASICQPEGTFDSSVAAQHQNPSEEQKKTLNTLIAWQIDNQHRGLNYIQLELKSAMLFVFVDGSFAKNHDLSSRIGYLILFKNEYQNDEKLRL